MAERNHDIWQKHELEKGRLVREYSGESELYAYREGEEHVVVSQGDIPDETWTKHVPAEREAVVPEERIWTIPNNWRRRLGVEGTAESFVIYRIPESGVDIVVRLPEEDSADPRYEVNAVGQMKVEYHGIPDWDRLQEWLEESDGHNLSANARAALEEISEKLENQFKFAYRKEVNERADGAFWETYDDPQTVIDEWEATPWRGEFDVGGIVEELCKVEWETASEVSRILIDCGALPARPPVELFPQNGKGLPEGYWIRALTEAGCSPAETVDYIMTNMPTSIHKESHSSWAKVRGKQRPSISQNVSSAKENLE